jgi:hypothetical protein
MKNLATASITLLMLFNTACENPAVESKEESSIEREEGRTDEVDQKVGGQSFCAGIVSTRSSSLNIRTAPEVANNICATIDKDEQVKISLEGSIDGFFKIKTDLCLLDENAFGYVSKQYITFDQSCAFQKDESIEDEETNLPPPVEEEREVSVISMNWDNKHKDYKKWTTYAYDAVTEFGKDMLASNPEDIKTFCPNYRNLGNEEKKMFWMHLVSSMTEFESGFKPETSFKEGFKDNNGDYIISRGLLQLSIESARGYDCTLDNAQDLHSAQKNLECGVRIINRWVRRDGRVAGNVDGQWRGGARYWSVLRKRASSSSHDKIVAKTRATSICK